MSTHAAVGEAAEESRAAGPEVVDGGGFFLQVLTWAGIPLWRKGNPHPSHIQNPMRLKVDASWIPEAHPFHSKMIDFRMWSPSLASVRKEEPQAVQVKGRKGGGCGIGFEWEV